MIDVFANDSPEERGENNTALRTLTLPAFQEPQMGTLTPIIVSGNACSFTRLN